MNVNVSVIVPVYNVEKYLVKCVESILSQSYSNFELLLVDDGSTDNSGVICDSFDDDRIVVIHKDNGGLSDARNAGINKSKGRYITFIDSDDTIDRKYLEILVGLIESTGAEISSCEFLFYNEGENLVISSSDKPTHGVLDGRDALKQMLVGRIHNTSACGLLILSDIAKKYMFPVGRYHEDDMTTYKYYLETKKAAFTSEKLYFYLQRKGSIMHQPFGQIDLDELDAADDIYNACKELGTEYERAALVKKTANYCQILFKHDDLKKVNGKAYERIKDFLSENMKHIMTNQYMSKKTKIKICLFRLHILKFLKCVWGK